MCGSSTPAPPDPVKTAQAQALYNTQAAKDALALNSIDQFSPYGSTTYQRNPDGTPKSQTVSLSPDVKKWLDSQFGASTSLQNAAQTQLGFLPTDKFQLPDNPDATGYAREAFGDKVIDPSKFADPLTGELYKSSAVDLAQAPSTQSIANTFFDQAKSRFQPDLDDARKAKDIELARRGIPVGSEIYTDEMNRLDRNQNNLYSDAARQAELAAGQEQSRLFDQNLNTAQYGGAEQQRLQGADLANRGFLGTQQNQQFNQNLQARGFGQNQYQTNLSNELLERNQPFSEAAALLGTTPNFQTPSFMNTSSQSISAPDYAGLVGSNYAAQVSAANNKNSALGGILGAAAGPLAKAAAPVIFSDEDYKTNRKTADGERILVALRGMPVDDYRYREGARDALDLPEHRTGAMAQDWQENFGTGDGHTIDVADAIGKLLAAVKSLDRRTAAR